jgi:hypothetical protein
MDDQFSIVSTDSSFAPFSHWNKKITTKKNGVECDPIRKNIDEVETMFFRMPSCFPKLFVPRKLASWAHDMYWDRTTTHQGCRSKIFSVASVTKIKVFATVQPDSPFECPTVGEEPTGDGEPEILMIVLNAYELAFLIGEWVVLIDSETQTAVHSKQARWLRRNYQV